MFGNSLRLSVFIFIVAACTQQEPQQLVSLPGEEWITAQLARYDSVYNIFFATDRISDSSLQIRITSHIYLDSIFQYEQQLMQSKDTALVKLLLNALYFKGLDLKDMGRYPEAETILNKFLAVRNSAGFLATPSSAFVHKTIGDIYSQFGDYSLALYHKKISLAFYIAANDIQKTAGESINISIPFYETAQYDSAIYYLKKGLLLKDVSPKRMLGIYTELAANYIKKNNADSAAIALQAGKKYFDELKNTNDGFEKLAAYKSIEAELLKQKEKYAEAVSSLHETLQYFFAAYRDTRKREIGKTYNELGVLFDSLHKKDSAIYCYNKALWTVTNIDTNNIFAVPQQNEIYAENKIIESLQQKAGWMQAYADTAANANPYFECAVNCYDLIQSTEYKLLQNFSYDESKLLMLKESRRRSEKAIAVCYQLYAADKNEKWIEKAFQFAEHNKAFILLESVKRNLAANNELKNDSVYLHLQQAQLNYAAAEKQLIEAGNARDSSGVRILSAQLLQQDALVQQIKSQLQVSDNAYKAIAEKQDTITIASVQKILNTNDEALIEFFCGSNESYAWCIFKNQPVRFIKVASGNMENVNSFINFFKNNRAIVSNVYAYENSAYELYKQWLQPLLAGTGIKKIICIADGQLNILPFDALLTQPAKSLSLQSLPYFIKTYSANFAYSASILINQQQGIYKNNTAISVFAPQFSNAERNLFPLRFSANELQAVQKQIPDGNYFLYKNATLKNFYSHAPSSSVIHIATHASAGNAMPQVEFIDSTLYLNELYAMHLHANLVVLSGCETGLGEIEQSEGVISLARGFYYAGAANVITSLWNIDDEATSALFNNFYAALNKNNYGDALHNSKIKYLQNAANNKCSPYYWAGLVVIGSNQPLSNSNTIYYAAAIAIVLVAVFIAMRRRKIF